MNFPSRETVERLRREYPAGTRVELVRMDDCQAPPAGTHGTVLGVDDTGSLLMKWDNGSGLNVVCGEDIVKKLDSVTTIYSKLVSSEKNLLGRRVVTAITYTRPASKDCVVYTQN